MKTNECRSKVYEQESNGKNPGKSFTYDIGISHLTSARYGRKQRSHAAE
jgi:hypothetical protein